MWKITKILEADFGCEERQPGEKLKSLVYLESESGEEIQRTVEDDWLRTQHLDEGGIWTENFKIQ